MKITLIHSPAPWVAHISDDGAFTVQVDDNTIIASRAAWGHRAGESRANAQLITAAPDLLEACEAARDFLDEIEWSEGGGNWYQEAVQKLDAALLKAYGQ
jgi:hypothetical protein